MCERFTTLTSELFNDKTKELLGSAAARCRPFRTRGISWAVTIAKAVFESSHDVYPFSTIFLIVSVVPMSDNPSFVLHGIDNVAYEQRLVPQSVYTTELLTLRYSLSLSSLSKLKSMTRKCLLK